MNDFYSGNPLTSAEIYARVDNDAKTNPTNDADFLEVRIALLDILMAMDCNDDKSWNYLNKIGNNH